MVSCKNQHALQIEQRRESEICQWQVTVPQNTLHETTDDIFATYLRAGVNTPYAKTRAGLRLPSYEETFWIERPILETL